MISSLTQVWLSTRMEINKPQMTNFKRYSYKNYLYYFFILLCLTTVQCSMVNCFTEIHCWGAGSKMLPQAVRSKIGIFWKEKGSHRSWEILF